MKKKGKVVVVGRLVVSKDGKTMAGDAKGTDDKGGKFDSVDVYEKK